MKTKSYLLALFLFCMSVKGISQISLPVFPDSLFPTYYHQRWTLFQSLPQTKNDIIFIGNSITDGGEWSEQFNDLKVKNRGISGDISAGIIKRIEEVIKRKPAKVFLMIGTNDLARGVSADSVVKNIVLIADYFYQETPSTKLFIQSILPVNAVFGKFSGHTNKAEQMQSVNKRLATESSAHHYCFIDLYSAFCNQEGKLDTRYSNDGLHLLGEGYLLWKHLVFPYVYDLQQKPSLIPMPQQLKWEKGFFPLFRCSTIIVKQKGLDKESSLLKDMLFSIGLNTTVQEKITGDENYVELRINKVESPVHSNEAYKISISETKIFITANTPHGIFNGIQTLKQLMRNGTMIDACEITDWPAFSWRGFMVDVGRNYQSIKQLKQQIDIMAWRLQSKLYPQLTDAKYMLRNPGEYYTLDDMKELIAYCKERYITLIPEIDMPGHSAAFTRAMGVDMQSEKGMEICKNILRELCNELEVPIVHIGGDEVKITNKDFLPGMIDLLKSYNKKIIAWNPGGNVPEGTILQMWQGSVVPKNKFPSVDSRHLYLNHFDPFDGVAATFNHQVCDVPVGDENKLGAILCNWPDRRVSKEEDLINMNAVYPVMLSFAERCWQGGGWKNYLSDIGSPGSERYNAFAEFEGRLLDHKTLYFKNVSFPYVKQSDVEWKLIGPFNNGGISSASFAPESKTFFDTVQLQNYPSVFGGTIWLRHFWHPMIQSHLKNPEDSSTWYAIRNSWSDEEGIKNFWIGFNNLSRSPNTDSPPVGAWDKKGSTVWVNGNRIDPPRWKRGGQKGNSETPLIDEGYEYREPTKIYLRKGWNTILIKAPVASLKDEWQNPVKWMFTLVEVVE
jgi:hexosaminidase